MSVYCYLIRLENGLQQLIQSMDKPDIFVEKNLLKFQKIFGQIKFIKHFDKILYGFDIKI